MLSKEAYLKYYHLGKSRLGDSTERRQGWELLCQ